MDRRAEAPMIKGTYNNKERASGRGREGERVTSSGGTAPASNQHARPSEQQRSSRTSTNTKREQGQAASGSGFGLGSGLGWTGLGGFVLCGDGRTVTARENGQGLLTLSFPRLDAPARSSRDKIWAVL